MPLPHLAERLQPVGYLGQLLRLDTTIALTPLLLYKDKTTFGQYLYVQGNGLAAYFKILRNSIQVPGIGRKHANDLSSGGVGNGLENISSYLHIICKCLLANICASICLRKFNL